MLHASFRKIGSGLLSFALYLITVPSVLAETDISEQKLDYLISVAAKYHQIDPALLHAVIWQESRRSQKAVSHKGAIGYTQLMPDTAREMGVNPRDPWHNIYGGAKYLRKMLDRYNNNPHLALAAYNAGPKRVKETVPDIPETRYYVAAVMYYYQYFGQK